METGEAEAVQSPDRGKRAVLPPEDLSRETALVQQAARESRDALEIGFGLEKEAEARNNWDHLLGLNERLSQVEEVLPEEFKKGFDPEVVKMAAFYHDLGKVDGVRGEIKDVHSAYDQWTRLGRSEDDPDAETFQFIDGLNKSQKLVLANAFKDDMVAKGHSVIDHQIISAIFVKRKLSEARKDPTVGATGSLDQAREQKLLDTILEHIGIPHFMLNFMAQETLGYPPGQLAGLASCTEYIDGSWEYKPYPSSPEAISQSLTEDNLAGFSSVESLVFNLLDASQLADPYRGSLRKLIEINCRDSIYWPKIEVGGKQYSVPMSFAGAYGMVLTGSFAEAQVQAEKVGSWIADVFKKVEDEAEYVRGKMAAEAEKRGFPATFGLKETGGSVDFFDERGSIITRGELSETDRTAKVVEEFLGYNQETQKLVSEYWPPRTT